MPETAIAKQLRWSLTAPHASGDSATGRIVGSLEISDDGGQHVYFLVADPSRPADVLVLIDDGSTCLNRVGVRQVDRLDPVFD